MRGAERYVGEIGNVPIILVSQMGEEIGGLFELYRSEYNELEPGGLVSPKALKAAERITKALRVHPNEIINLYKQKTI